MCKPRLTLRQIMERGDVIHGEGEYDYSEIEYKNSATPVKIRHVACGTIFFQAINDHLNHKYGCPECFGVKLKTLKQVKMEFVSIHGDKYNYEKFIEYKGTHVEVEIVCRKCQKSFWQTPHTHLRGGGCPPCSEKIKRRRISEARSLTNDDFITRSKRLYGDKFSYKNTNYTGYDNKVELIHNECGKSFIQQAGYHLAHGTCPNCPTVGFSKKSIIWLERIAEIEGFEIQHAQNGGEEKIFLKDYPSLKTKAKIYKKGFQLDGICHEKLIAFEFHGDRYHSCEKHYPNRDEKNIAFENKTHREIFDRTKEKELLISEIMDLYVVWECDFDDGKLYSYKYINGQLITEP